VALRDVRRDLHPGAIAHSSETAASCSGAGTQFPLRRLCAIDWTANRRQGPALVPWDSAQHSFNILTAIATALSIWALLRTYLLTRPRLVLIQPTLLGRNYTEWRDTEATVGISLLVTNPRSQPNAITSWAAQIEGKDGQPVCLSVRSMELHVARDRTTHCGVVLTIPAYGAVETPLAILGLPKDVPLPLRLKITAKDLFLKTYTIECAITREHALDTQPASGAQPAEWKIVPNRDA
jgi:hypothetical protein